MKKQIIRRSVAEMPIFLQQASLPAALKKIYATRSIQTESELNLELSGLLPYQSLLNIDQATQLLSHAIQHNQRILIVGDFDADGATSTALAIRALNSFGAKNVFYLVPNRFVDGYGLTPELVETAKKFEPDLIITVDNGIANHAGVAAAKEANIKVIVTDHHLPAATLPVADVIVNPNQPFDTFPSKHLAGVGVIFYVMLAVRKCLQTSNWFVHSQIPEPNMAKLLDLVALGTIADLVPLDYNNRILVSQGLRRMRAGQCIPAMPALLELSKKDIRHVVSSDLGFAMGARLNAAGRLEDMSLGIECLLTDDVFQARQIAKQLDQLNDERRYIEKEMQLQAFSIVDKVSVKFQGQIPTGLCLYDASWHQGVIGILAARLKDRFNRPTIIFAPGQTGEMKGSARSINGFHIRDSLAQLNVQFPGLILKFGGHAMAAGLTIKTENLPSFIDAFNDIATEQLTDDQLAPIIYSDGELEIHELEMTLAECIKDVIPWGQHFPEPIFDNDFEIVEQRIVGDKHLKLKLLFQNKKRMDAIMFFADLAAWPNHRCRFVKAVYRLDINEYQSFRQLQLIIDYLEPL